MAWIVELVVFAAKLAVGYLLDELTPTPPTRYDWSLHLRPASADRADTVAPCRHPLNLSHRLSFSPRRVITHGGTKRKNRAGEVLVTVKAITETASVAVIQSGEVRLVVLCKM